MRTLFDLPTPALLLDLDALERNLRRMAERARRFGVALRPHVKTHKCVEIAFGQRELGASGITVSTLHEARAFAAAGFDDITWAFPLPPERAPDVARLAEHVHLGVVVDSSEALEALRRANAGTRVWLKIDCGYHRAGLAPDSPSVEALAEEIGADARLRFAGLLSHSGQAYRARSPRHVARIAEEERRVLSDTAERLRARGLPVEGVSIGSTPSVNHAHSLDGVTEIRPGNYALYDYTQVALGSCAVADCAATVLATVVSSRPSMDTCVVDAGALALSLDAGPASVSRRSHGRIYAHPGSGELRADARLHVLSQEHGIMSPSLPVGRKIRVLPNHSCLTVACFDAFDVVRAEEVVDSWAILRGR